MKIMITANCFKCFSAILVSTVVLPSVKPNSWDCRSMVKNVQGIQQYSGYWGRNDSKGMTKLEIFLSDYPP
jgi:hypothetical protein